MKVQELDKRRCDSQGCGHYGASRGSRKHNGIDLACEPGTPIQLGISGKIVKVGWAYSDPKKSELRYVAIRLDEDINNLIGGIYGNEDYYCRVFYVSTELRVGDHISGDIVMGESKDLAKFYPGMTNHVHFELYSASKGIHNRSGFKYLNPNTFLEYIKEES